MANHYVRQGASGSADGSDWTNAWTSLASITFVRGDTYYIAGETYAGRTLNTAVSGTQLITIKGAIVSDHGTDTGWDSSYSVAVSPAHFTGVFTFASGSSYWLFDGMVGTGNTASSFGFVWDDNGSGSAYMFQLAGGAGQTYTDITIKHIYAIVSNRDNEKEFLQTTGAAGYCNNITVSYCYFVGWQGVIMPGFTTSPFTGWLFERNYVYWGWSGTVHHGEDVNCNGAGYSGLVCRYNIFDSRGGNGSGGSTAVIVANNGPMNDSFIYGNIFVDNTGCGNGIISDSSAGNMSGCLIYNNTFIRNTGGGAWFGHAYSGTGNVTYNNLVYNQNGSRSLQTSDYNAYFSTTTPPTEANGQISAADPFIASTGGDYHLAENTDAGIDLGAPYNVDMDGITRTTWSRGAYEYSPEAPVPIIPFSTRLRF